MISVPALVLIVLVEAAVLLGVIYRLRLQLEKLAQINISYQRERRALIGFLDKVGERITSALDFEGALDIITDFLVEASKAESGAIFLIDERSNSLSARSVVGLFPPIHTKTDYVLTRPKHLQASLRHDRIEVGEGIIGLVAKEGEPLLIADAESDQRLPASAFQGTVPVHSIMLAPLKIRGRLLGVFAVVNKRDDEAFKEEDMSLLITLADQAAVTADIFQLHQEMARKKQIEVDLRLARDFQRILLPRETPTMPGFEFAAYSEAALDLGGDYYDFIPLDDCRLGIAIGDVSGKGIRGALIMAMVRSALRAEAHRQPNPRDVLRHLNERLLRDTSDSVFVTMTYGVLDTRRRTFRFARCGHEPTIVASPESTKVRLHTPDGIALGLVGDPIFEVVEEEEIVLTEGDVAVLYTDGVIEAMDPHDNEYGQERLLRIVERHRGGARELIDRIVDDVGKFTKGISQHDDLTMVVIRSDRSAEAGRSDERAVTDDRFDSEAASRLRAGAV